VEIEPLSSLRRRESVKWRAYPPDVLPLFVAEMDYPVAEPIREAIAARVAASDLGYAFAPGRMGEAFAGFAERHWGWAVDPVSVRTTTDVSVTIVETLRRAIRPGDGVVITPPVYPPFFELVPEAGGRVVEVPLVEDGSSWELDVDGIDAALAAGARAVLIANPHNPLGVLPRRLGELAEVAARHGAIVVSDEIHAPLVHAGQSFTPFLTVSDAARAVGVTVTSASKAFNIAGTKCALMVAGSPTTRALLDGMWEEVTFRTSLLGLHANLAAFEYGDAWLADAVAEIEASSARLAGLLAEHLPGVGYRPPAASYLAWLDFRGLPEWGDDPAELALARGVALNPGPAFGTPGRGFARLNFACSADVLTEAVRRLAT
jgi:cysteine-S-conjugate beta-lyase